MRAGKPSFGTQTGQRLAASVLQAGGLRERKKAVLRQRISDTATALFLEHGFDEVTVAQVAKAVDVSVKTVFNYFGSKEDLLFDREPQWLEAIDRLAASRAPGVGFIRVLEADVAVRWPALDFGRWDALTEPSLVGRRAFYSLIAAHPGLQARRRQMSERIDERIAAVVVGEFDDPASPAAITAATLVGAAYGATGTEYARQILLGAPAPVVVERCKAVGLHALGVLEDAYRGTSLVEGPPA